MPFTTEMHVRLKQNLRANLTTLAALQGAKGAKLRFHPEAGLFEHETNRKERTDRNKSSENIDSAKNEDMFHDPILVTMYEGKKESLKPLGLSEELLRKALWGLQYLSGVTYGGLLTGGRRKAIEKVLDRSKALLGADDPLKIDQLINQWVDFAIPAGVPQIVSDDVWRIISFACSDHEMTELIINGLYRIKEAEMNVTALVYEVRRVIYYQYYKPGGGNVGSAPLFLATETYLKDLAEIAKGHTAVAVPQGDNRKLTDVIRRIKNGEEEKAKTLEDLGFIFFHSNKWKCGKPGYPRATARVYIHIKSDVRGRAAREAVKVIFKHLASSNEQLLTQFQNFKISNLHMLYEYQDNIVMWTANLATAQALADALKGDLTKYTAAGLPTGVKLVSQGIGISAEPEPMCDWNYAILDHPVDTYSYGTYRSEIIARGLINAASRAYPYALPDLTTCAQIVAETFNNLGLDPLNPHTKGKIEELLMLPANRRGSDPGRILPRVTQRRPTL
jgi:hypothetical protein